MQPQIHPGALKKVEKKGNILKIQLENNIEIDEKTFRLHWKILRSREAALAKEKLRLMDIAKKAKIKLE